MDKDEIKLLDYQLIALALFLISIITSIIVIFDERQALTNRKRIFDKEIDTYLNLLNKFMLISLTILFIYTNYKGIQIAKKKGENLSPYNEQMLAALLSFAAALLVLDATLKSPDSTEAIENPFI